MQWFPGFSGEQGTQVGGLAERVARPGLGERAQARTAQPRRRATQRQPQRQPPGPPRVVAQLAPGEPGRIDNQLGSVPRRRKHGGRA